MKITESVHAIKHEFSIPVSPEKNIERFVYSYALFGKDKVILVDSGVSDSKKTIVHYISDYGYSLSDIKVLILTHSHPDHIGSAQFLKEKSDCQVLAHEGEIQWIENIDQQFSDRPVPGFKSLVNESVQIDKFIKDKDVIDIEGVAKIDVLHTPGHSKGALSLYIKDEKVLITADSLILSGTFPIYDDVLTTIKSINKLKSIANIKWLLSSWDEPRTGDEIAQIFEQSTRYLRSIHKIIQKIEAPEKLKPLELCEKVVNDMKLPPVAVNPLVARSLMSHIRYLGQEL